MITLWTPSYDCIAGFLDADGSFEAKVFLGKRAITYHVNFVLSQRASQKDKKKTTLADDKAEVVKFHNNGNARKKGINKKNNKKKP